MVDIVFLFHKNSDRTYEACFFAMSPRYLRYQLSAEPNLAESNYSEDASLFGDPDPEIFLAAIPFLEPNAHSRTQHVEH
jgi:hypothetical protein